MKEKASILLVGIGGYGEIYLNNLLRNDRIKLSGVVDPRPENSIYYKEIKQKNIPIFNSMMDFYSENRCDLAIISTPIQLHTEQTIYALKNGSNVLCEKPLSSNIKDIQKIIQIRNRQNKFVAVGFNWSFTNPIQQLKKDMMSGKFGKVRRLKSIVLWPRSKDYYSRSNWAGKMYHTNGEPIFDSIANNAAAHFLHNLFYLTGDSVNTSAKLKHITPELYRANSIETFDTCAIKSLTSNNITMYFYASHAVEVELNPMFEIECENATITYNANKNDSSIQVIYKNGRSENYDDPEFNHLAKLDTCLQAIEKNETNILCNPEAVLSHMSCIHTIHKSIKEIPKFPDNIMSFNKKKNLISVEGLANILFDCYQDWTLPSDKNISWTHAVKTTEV